MSTTGMTFYPSAPSSLAGAQALDTSWFLKAPEKGVSDFMSKRAKGAKFLDVTHLGHPDGGIHAIPSATTYEAFLKSNDISPTTPLLLYQGKDAMAMYYSWYWLKYGAKHEGYVGCSQVPGGGFRDVEEGDLPEPASCENVGPLTRVPGGWGKFVNKEFVKAVVGGDESGVTIVDVRGAGRFMGEEKEARAGVRSGHMKGAKNLPFPKVLKEGWCALKEAHVLREILGGACNLEGEGRIVVTCGSGVTACIVATALEKVGVASERVACYDGSWAEWGAAEDTEVVTGDE